MSRLRTLNDEINKITSEPDANKLVKAWLPHQASGIDKGFLACAPGVRNCSLIAEFVLTYMNMGVIDFLKLSSSLSTGTTVKPPYDNIPFTGDRSDALYAELSTGGSGHSLALLREGTTYALYQAWEGQFHVFPKLNPGNESHNVFGEGDTALSDIRKMLSATCKTASLKVCRGFSLLG